MKVLKKGFRCSRCEFVSGKLKIFQRHMLDTHDVSDLASEYITSKLDGAQPLCGCKCGKELPFMGWNVGFAGFLKGHNASFHNYMSEENAKRMSEIRAKGMREHGPCGWSKGKTKETDASLAQAAATRSKTVTEQFASGERVAWSKGRTKDDDERLMKQGKTLSELHKTGQITAWHKGKTKETDERLAKMGATISNTLREESLRRRLIELKKLDLDEIRARIKRNAPTFELLSDLKDYVRMNEENLIFKCKVCESTQTRSLFSIMTNRCYTCDPAGSHQQIEIEKFVNSLGFKTSMCDRTVISPYEIDIFIPEKNIGIEFNGCYFHSELYKDKGYHDRKTSLAAAKNVRLLHVFDDEWREKRDICESMVRDALGIEQQMIVSSDDCELIEIDSQMRESFFEENYIDGDVRATAAYALTQRNVVFAAMSIRRPQIGEADNMCEIVRFCPKKHHTVSDACKKLFSAAVDYSTENKHAGIVVFSDERNCDDREWSKLGMQFIGRRDPTFWWTDGSTRIPHHKVRQLANENAAYQNVADELGVFKIWGCKNRVYELRF